VPPQGPGPRSGCGPDRLSEQPHRANPPNHPVRSPEGWGRQLCRKGQGPTLSGRSAQAAHPIACRSAPISRIHPTSRFEFLKLGDASVPKGTDGVLRGHHAQAAHPIAWRSASIPFSHPTSRFEFLKRRDARFVCPTSSRDLTSRVPHGIAPRVPWFGVDHVRGRPQYPPSPTEVLRVPISEGRPR
jgi:hypothetical protein